MTRSRVHEAGDSHSPLKRPRKPCFRRARLLGVGLGLFFLTAPAAFARPGAPLRWRNLPPRARRVLHPFAPRWRHLPPARRRRLLRAARRWLRSPPARRKEMMKRLRAWRRLPPRLRRRLWNRYRAFRRLPPAERRRILRAYRLFRRLPPWKQRALLRRWKHRHRRGGPGRDRSLVRFLPVLRIRSRAQRSS